MEPFETALAGYVDALVKRGAIVSESVERAFRAVPRHRFVDGWYRLDIDDDRVAYRPVEYDRDHPTEEQLEEIYSNRALVTEVKHSTPTSSTSQPSLVAGMLELLDLRPGMRVLEIGAGTGYNAALLAEILGSEGRVCSIEFQEDVEETARSHLQNEGYDDVRTVRGDGYFGAPEEAPFDRIVVTVGCPDLSPHWLEQLSADGSLLLPLRHAFSDPLVRIERDPADAERAVGRIVDRSSFMSIQGTLASANPWLSYRILGLPEEPTSTYPLPNGIAPQPAGMVYPFDHPEQHGLVFFLALSSRELWGNNQGYGLADPGSSSVLIMTRDGVEGYSATDDRAALDRLYDRFLHIQREWHRLGCPVPEDYSLVFTPATRLERIPQVPGRDWIIVRPFFFEIVRLPEADPASREEGRCRSLRSARAS